MKVNAFYKLRYSLCAMLLCALCLASCSKSEYVNAIPANSTALLALDAGKMNQDKAENFLKSFLHLSGNMAECGIDFKEKLFVFETVDGNLGLCARVNDCGDLRDFIDNMSKSGCCTKTKKRGDNYFSDINDSWALGFSDGAMLVMGPVPASALPETHRLIAKCLKQDEERGVKSSPLYAKLDSVDASVALVVQVNALPDKFAAPLSLGVPKGADISNVYVAADIKKENGIVVINGKTFSLNKKVNSQIEKARASFRKINASCLNTMTSDMLAGFFCNVDGKQFLPILQSNPSLQALLAGVNTAIDMDQIIRSVNGSFAIVGAGMSGHNLDGIIMRAQLGDSKWLADVGYWKQSCPVGGRIDDCGPNSYRYSGGGSTFFFGVDKNLEFYGGSDAEQVKGNLSANSNTWSKEIGRVVDGKRMAMVLNIDTAIKKIGIPQNLVNLVMPLAKDIKSIVYIVE